MTGRPQYPEEVVINREAAAYWITRSSSRVMTAVEGPRLVRRGRRRAFRSLLIGSGALVGGSLLAFGTEFLAFLALKSLGVGLLGTFERLRGARFCHLLVGCRGCRGITLGGGRRRCLRQDRACEQEQGREGGGGHTGGYRHHGSTSG